MARIRSIKPEFWTSEQLVECSTSARLLFIGLWNFSDDAGIHQDSAKRIKMEIFPADDISIVEIESMIQELVTNELLERYKVNGKSYLIVTGWDKHQRIDRPTFRHPLPDGSTSIRRVFDESSPPESSREESSGDKPVRPVGGRPIDFKKEWPNILPVVKEIHEAVDPGRKLKTEDRELAIKTAIIAGKLNGSVSQILSGIERKRRTEDIKRPWAYLRKSLIRAVNESGLQFDSEWSAIEIPPDILTPPRESRGASP